MMIDPAKFSNKENSKTMVDIQKFHSKHEQGKANDKF